MKKRKLLTPKGWMPTDIACYLGWLLLVAKSALAKSIFNEVEYEEV